jgi:hypothetical protein
MIVLPVVGVARVMYPSPTPAGPPVLTHVASVPPLSILQFEALVENGSVKITSALTVCAVLAKSTAPANDASSAEAKGDRSLAAAILNQVLGILIFIIFRGVCVQVYALGDYRR